MYITVCIRVDIFKYAVIQYLIGVYITVYTQIHTTIYIKMYNPQKRYQEMKMEIPVLNEVMLYDRLFREYCNIFCSEIKGHEKPSKKANQEVDHWFAIELLQLMKFMMNPENRVIVTHAIEFILNLKLGGIAFQNAHNELMGSTKSSDLSFEEKYYLNRQLKEIWKVDLSQRH